MPQPVPYKSTFSTAAIRVLAQQWRALATTVQAQTDAMNGAVTGVAWNGPAGDAARAAWTEIAYQLPAPAYSACQDVAASIAHYPAAVEKYQRQAAGHAVPHENPHHHPRLP